MGRIYQTIDDSVEKMLLHVKKSDRRRFIELAIEQSFNDPRFMEKFQLVNEINYLRQVAPESINTIPALPKIAAEDKIKQQPAAKTQFDQEYL